MTPEASALSENLREAMRFFGAARPDGMVRRLAAVTLVSSGIDYSVFNAAVLGSPVRGRMDGLGMEMKEAEEFYARRGLPWSFWACEDLIEENLRVRLRDALEAMNLRHLTTAPGLFLERLRPPTRKLPEIVLKPVGDPETRSAFAHITSMAFDIPLAICRAVYAEDRAWHGSYVGWLGYQGRTPVSTTALVVTGGLIGVYSVATLPAFQRRGYAEAVMREAIGRTTAETGIEPTGLQSTSAGMPLYRQMGYQQVTRFQVFASRR
ncbi:MAG TPA: GNAT family N-acetyltransferase [Bryobacteraceae bacterium]|nr:GNAT family N-acetyltransferase [Bryobacteraceae bacterium]